MSEMTSRIYRYIQMVDDESVREILFMLLGEIEKLQREVRKR